MAVKIVDKEINSNWNSNGVSVVGSESYVFNVSVDYQLRNNSDYYKLCYYFIYEDLEIYKEDQLGKKIRAYQNLSAFSEENNECPIEVYEKNKNMYPHDVVKSFCDVNLYGSSICYIRNEHYSLEKSILTEMSMLDTDCKFSKLLLLSRKISQLEDELRILRSRDNSTLFVTSINKTIQKLDEHGNWYDIINKIEMYREANEIKECEKLNPEKENVFNLVIPLEKEYDAKTDKWIISNCFDLNNEINMKLKDAVEEKVSKDMKKFLKVHTDLYKVAMF